MLSFNRVMLGALLGLLAALAMAVPSQAAVVKAACLVNGNAKVSDKANLTDTTRGVNLTGGHGNYRFKQADFTCVGLEKGAPGIVSFSVDSKGYFDNVECGTGKAISQWGAGNNTIVGNNFGRIGGNLSKNQAYYQAILDDLKYAVDFTAGVGLFFWHNAPKSAPGSKPLSSVKQPTIPKLGTDTKGPWESDDPTTPAIEGDKEYVFAGIIVLSFPVGPQPVGKPPWAPPRPADNHCTNSFDARGVILLDIF